MRKKSKKLWPARTLREENMLPGHPPEDYRGSIARWCVELMNRGLWNGEGWYGDVRITEQEYVAILDICES